MDRVKWVPSWGHSRIRGMLENRPDWTISRQRTWGVPIPIAYCQGCEHPVISGQLMERVADAVEKAGAGVWYSTPVEQFLGLGYKCAECGKTEFRRETDILDVWFDSACSFAAVAAKRPSMGVPVDLYLEGSDQHRGWFHSTMLVGVGTRDHSPYKTCLTHGFVVDGAGEKMSEEPRQRGAAGEDHHPVRRRGDAALGGGERLPQRRAALRPDPQGPLEGYRKIRNTLRYALSNLYDFDPAKDAVAHAELPLDRWARGRLADLVQKVRGAYESYEFHLVYQAVVDFCAGDLSAIYFDILKDRLYTSKATGHSRRSAQTVLHEVAVTLLQLLRR